MIDYCKKDVCAKLFTYRPLQLGDWPIQECCHHDRCDESRARFEQEDGSWICVHIEEKLKLIVEAVQEGKRPNIEENHWITNGFEYFF